MRLHRVKNLLPAPKDAVRRYLVVSPGELRIDKDNNWKGGNTVSVGVWMQKGESDPTQQGIGDFQVQVFKDGAVTPELIRTQTSFTFTASKTATYYEIKLVVGEVVVDTYPVRIGLDGSDGDDSVFFVLKPSRTSIDFVKDQTGKALTPNSVSIYCGYVRYQGENALVFDGTVVANLRYIDEKYAIYYRLINKNTLGNWTATYSETNGTLTVGKNDAVTGVEFAMSSASAASNVTEDNIITRVTVPVHREGLDGSDGQDGHDGQDGQDGNGVSGMQDYFLATTMATGVTRSTGTWTTDYQFATPDKPYVWKYTKTYWTNGSPTYSDCILVFSYSAGGNPNLLEQTNFSSMHALDKWQARGNISWVDGVTPVAENVAEITTGLQAHNAYHERTTKTTNQIQLKEILRQVLWNSAGNIRKIEASTWYTLSFWYKGEGCKVFIYPSCVNNNVTGYIDGVASSISGGGGVTIPASSVWVRHSITFKTLATIGDTTQYVLWRMYGVVPGSDISTNHSYICMPKLEVGMQATGYVSNESSTHFGQPRNRRWALNTLYMTGDTDEQYDDCVLVDETGFYHCIKSHISDLTNKPGLGTYWRTYWEPGSKIENLATDIFFAEKAYVENLIAMMIQTGYEGTPHIEAHDSTFKIFGYGQYPAIELAINSNSKAVLRFYNEDTGEFLYDLGPDQINQNVTQKDNSWTEWKLKAVSGGTATSLTVITNSECTSYYRFNEGFTQTGNVKTYNVSGTSSPSAKNSCFFTTKNYNGTKISDGWYEKANNGIWIQTSDSDNGQLIGSTSSTVSYEVVRYRFYSGKLAETKRTIIEVPKPTV